HIRNHTGADRPSAFPSEIRSDTGFPEKISGQGDGPDELCPAKKIPFRILVAGNGKRTTSLRNGIPGYCRSGEYRKCCCGNSFHDYVWTWHLPCHDGTQPCRLSCKP